MAFYIKIWTFTYLAIKCHIFMADPLSCCAVKKREKPIDNISRYCYIISREKPIDNISRYRGYYPHDFYLFKNVKKLY